ncbi:hypothetical protein I552_8363 [Mycobacterium xenopi 3993]|nr:hypothetical protein I552_8363 [Mycobacterium xenopi 3993]
MYPAARAAAVASASGRQGQPDSGRLAETAHLGIVSSA